MHETRQKNPLFGPNLFKLGIFSANCDGGLTMSLAPERWRANWDDIAAMTRIADDAGIEFILPVAKWRGYQGKANRPVVKVPAVPGALPHGTQMRA